MKKLIFIASLIVLSFSIFGQTGTTLNNFVGVIQYSGATTSGVTIGEYVVTMGSFSDQTNLFNANDIQAGDIAWDNSGRRWRVDTVLTSNLLSADVEVTALTAGAGGPFGVGFVNREVNGLGSFPPDNSTGISQQLKSRVETHYNAIIRQQLKSKTDSTASYYSMLYGNNNTAMVGSKDLPYADPFTAWENSPTGVIVGLTKDTYVYQPTDNVNVTGEFRVEAGRIRTINFPSKPIIWKAFPGTTIKCNNTSNLAYIGTDGFNLELSGMKFIGNGTGAFFDIEAYAPSTDSQLSAVLNFEADSVGGVYFGFDNLNLDIDIPTINTAAPAASSQWFIAPTGGTKPINVNINIGSTNVLWDANETRNYSGGPMNMNVKVDNASNQFLINHGGGTGVIHRYEISGQSIGLQLYDMESANVDIDLFGTAIDNTNVLGWNLLYLSTNNNSVINANLNGTFNNEYLLAEQTNAASNNTVVNVSGQMNLTNTHIQGLLRVDPRTNAEIVLNDLKVYGLADEVLNSNFTSITELPNILFENVYIETADSSFNDGITASTSTEAIKLKNVTVNYTGGGTPISFLSNLLDYEISGINSNIELVTTADESVITWTGNNYLDSKLPYAEYAVNARGNAFRINNAGIVSLNGTSMAHTASTGDISYTPANGATRFSGQDLRFVHDSLAAALTPGTQIIGREATLGGVRNVGPTSLIYLDTLTFSADTNPAASVFTPNRRVDVSVNATGTDAVQFGLPTPTKALENVEIYCFVFDDSTGDCSVNSPGATLLDPTGAFVTTYTFTRSGLWVIRCRYSSALSTWYWVMSGN